jgi:hypothetical protein
MVTRLEHHRRAVAARLDAGVSRVTRGHARDIVGHDIGVGERHAFVGVRHVAWLMDVLGRAVKSGLHQALRRTGFGEMRAIELGGARAFCGAHITLQGDDARRADAGRVQARIGRRQGRAVEADDVHPLEAREVFPDEHIALVLLHMRHDLKIVLRKHRAAIAAAEGLRGPAGLGGALVHRQFAEREAHRFEARGGRVNVRDDQAHMIDAVDIGNRHSLPPSTSRMV